MKNLMGTSNHKSKIRNLGLILGIAALTGCSSLKYKNSTADYLHDYHKPAETEIALETRKKALESKVYDFIPFKREQMYFYDPRHITWYLFGNDYNGVFGEGYTPSEPYSTNINFKTFFDWNFARNLGHNMKHYPPLGSANFDKHLNWQIFDITDEKVSILGKYRNVDHKDDFNFRLELNDFKPFIHLRIKKFNTGIGWRKRGNFAPSFRFSD